MITFDTDVLTDVLRGRADYVRRVSSNVGQRQTVPVVVVEEILRGRLNVIRQAEAGKSRVSIELAYTLFQEPSRIFDGFRYSPTRPKPKLCIGNGRGRVSGYPRTTLESPPFASLMTPR